MLEPLVMCTLWVVVFLFFSDSIFHLDVHYVCYTMLVQLFFSDSIFHLDVHYVCYTMLVQLFFQTGMASIIILTMEICKVSALQISIISIIIDATPVWKMSSAIALYNIDRGARARTHTHTHTHTVLWTHCALNVDGFTQYVQVCLMEHNCYSVKLCGISAANFCVFG